MTNFKRILYWKWGVSIFEPGQLKARVQDILNRSEFDILYVSFHHIHLPFTAPRLLATIEECCRLLEGTPLKLMLDIDIRNEGETFFAQYPGSRAYLARSVELQLNEYGEGSIEIDIPIREHYGRKAVSGPPDSILKAWAFHLAGNAEDQLFDPASLTEIDPYVFMENAAENKVRFLVQAGQGNANKQAILFPAVSHAIPDPFSPAMVHYYQKLLNHVDHLPLAGIANDEWGYDLCLQYDGDQQMFYLHFFPYSPYMSLLYGQRTGRKLEEELLYLRYAPLGDEGLRIRAINSYVDTLRAGMKANNDWFYEQGKRLFGTDAFIGVHPTLWGEATNFNFDVLLNGLDWWEVKRDYAQTDEGVLIPTRLALAHKWGGTVWYNMWYSGFTLLLETYFHETWMNARYGGRTHYLGYECPNEGAVLELNKPGSLEQIAEMERLIARINSFQTTQPDSRVLVVFGMEAATNWHISDPGRKIWTNRGNLLHLAAEFTKNLFERGYLCDFVPSSEIANGDVQFVDGKAKYGTQMYDAVVWVYPEGMDERVLQFMQQYKANNGQLIVVGACRYFNDGTQAVDPFQAFANGLAYYFAEQADADQVIAALTAWGVPGNLPDQGCIYQDGSIIFTAQGVKPSGNPLNIDCVVHGFHLQAVCEDFLAIHLAEDGTILRLSSSNLKHLSINGIAQSFPGEAQETAKIDGKSTAN